ncbi:MAG: porin [Chromatiales bacterium]|nr:porin [Chromatiales bacterium]
MKKNLIALAVAGALAAPAAAMADATVYGKLHMSVDSYDNGGDDNVTLQQDGEASGLAIASNSSRFGIKGSEDLGSGLTAIWQAESTLNMDDGSGSLSNRNTYVGFKGGFGTVMAGHHDSPVKTIGRKADLFGDQVGDSRSIIRGRFAGADLDPRTSNMLMYVSPSMGAIQAAVQYSPDEDSSDATTNVNMGTAGGYVVVSTTVANNPDTSHLSAAVWYDQGPLYVALGYSEDQADDGAAGYADETAMRLVGSYKMDALKFTALYQQAEGLGNVDGDDADMWGIGAAFNMGGGNTVKAQYYSATLESKAAGATDAEATVWAIGFDHAMSKQTSVYAAYSVSENDAGTNNGINVTPWGGTGHDNLASGVNDESASALSVGVVHKF